jgi:hypothetical protein
VAGTFRLPAKVSCSVRFPLLLALALASAPLAYADRVITIPTGKKVPYRTVKFDTFIELSGGRSWDRYIGVGVSPEIEIAYHGEKFSGSGERDTLDFSYNYVSPIINASPGISVGVLDVLNRTQDGRRLYIAATFRQAVDNVGMGNLPLEATIGLSQGRRMLPLVGVSVPLSDALRMLVESDGMRISAGSEVRLLNNKLGARLFVRERTVMVGANLTLKF